MKYLKAKLLTITSGISLVFNPNVRMCAPFCEWCAQISTTAAHMVMWVMSDRGKGLFVDMRLES